jgi:hypothetical protein
MKNYTFAVVLRNSLTGAAELPLTVSIPADCEHLARRSILADMLGKGRFVKRMTLVEEAARTLPEEFEPRDGGEW